MLFLNQFNVLMYLLSGDDDSGHVENVVVDKTRQSRHR